MAERNVLELLIRARKEGDAAKKTAGELDKLKKSQDGATASAKKLNIAMLAAKGAALTAGMAFLKSIPDIVDYGVEVGRAETALIAYAGSSEEAALAVELMKDAAGGAMSKMDAMRNATRMLSMGLADNADEAARLTKIAITLGSTMGKGPKQAIEEFTLMLANQSILRLDTFGISGANVREIMKDLAAQGIAPADRQMRFLIATMAEAEGKMAGLEAAGYEATSSLDRFKATIEDVKAGVATWLADGLMPWIDGIYALRDAHKEHTDEMIYGKHTYEEYRAEMMRLYDAHTLATGQVKLLSSAEWEAERATKAWKDAHADFIEKFKEGEGVVQASADENRDFALSLGEVTQATLAKEAMEKLNEAYKSGDIDLAEYRTTFIDVATNIAGMDSDAIRAQLALATLNEEFAERGDLDLYLGGIEDLGAGIGALPDHKKIIIEVEYQVTGEPIRGQHGLNMTVPPGFPNDNFPIFVSSGEHVNVTPAGQTTNDYRNQNQSIGPIYIQDSEDEQAFLSKLKRAVSRS